MVSADTYFTGEGGLMAYGNDSRDIFQRAPSYVDRILRGEKAGRPAGAESS
jgi:hypothetical protein